MLEFGFHCLKPYRLLAAHVIDGNVRIVAIAAGVIVSPFLERERGESWVGID